MIRIETYLPCLILLEEAEAQRTGNEVTIQSLCTQLDQDSTFDLSELLRQLADSYPPTREAFAEAARHQPEVSDGEQNETEDFAADCFEIQSQVEGDVDIRYPLHKWILNLISSRRHLPRSPDDLAQLETLDTFDLVALNELIDRGHVLWQFWSCCCSRYWYVGRC